VLALWFDAAGVVGRRVHWALHGAIGAATVMFQRSRCSTEVSCCCAGPRGDRTRMFIGFSIALVGR
jgi:hypothetical protein